MRISPEEAARTKEALAVLASCGIDRMDMPELGVAYRLDGQGELVEEGMEASPCEHVDPDGSVTAAVFDGRDMPSTDCVDVIGETPDMAPLDTDRILAMLEESDRRAPQMAWPILRRISFPWQAWMSGPEAMGGVMASCRQRKWWMRRASSKVSSSASSPVHWSGASPWRRISKKECYRGWMERA